MYDSSGSSLLCWPFVLPGAELDGAGLGGVPAPLGAKPAPKTPQHLRALPDRAGSSNGRSQPVALGTALDIETRGVKTNRPITCGAIRLKPQGS